MVQTSIIQTFLTIKIESTNEKLHVIMNWTLDA